MTSPFTYIRQPAEIYRRSFDIVSNEAELDRLPQDMRAVATRMIHACGMVDIVDDIEFSENAVSAGKAALQLGMTPDAVLVDQASFPLDAVSKIAGLTPARRVVLTEAHGSISGADALLAGTVLLKQPLRPHRLRAALN